MSETTSSSPRAIPGWTRTLGFVAIIGVGVGMLAAVAGRAIGLPFHVGLGVFFLSFAVLKAAVACEARHRLLAAKAGRPDPRDAERLQVSMPIVLYKWAACGMSVFAGIYVLTVGAAKVDRLFGG